MLESIKTKICNGCQIEKSVEEFSKDKTKKDGLQNKCKECNKAYNQANAEKILVNHKAYCQTNREAIAEQKRAYRQSNAEKYAEYHKTYRQTPIGKAAKKNSDHKRRSLTKQGDVTSAQLLDLTTNAKVCYWCNKSLNGKKNTYRPLRATLKGRRTHIK